MSQMKERDTYVRSPWGHLAFGCHIVSISPKNSRWKQLGCILIKAYFVSVYFWLCATPTSIHCSLIFLLCAWQVPSPLSTPKVPPWRSSVH